MSIYQNETLKRYLEDLAARLPAPGGGSAAALTASLGAALISMVINFTLGKPRHTKYTDFLNTALKESERFRKRFLELVDLDVVAYRSKDFGKSLDVPLEVARLCFKSIKLCPHLIKKGNLNLISDVAVAAVLLESAFFAANFNVDINLKYLKDKKLSNALRKDLSKKGQFIKNLRLKIEEKVNEIIRGQIYS
ncbi:MAG: cyclodeaminase/cyclohydrolase family protein [Candidatus Omnitrophica bacterium]|nr:cyclodeaminase/cyclohydrolase family protein [Candidatus Omnitrophota bacterium]